MRTANNKEGGKITEASALVYLLLATALFVDFGWGYKVNISVLFQLLNIKQLLDVVFKIFRIIKVEVGVISWSWRMRLITLTETLIILDITKYRINEQQQQKTMGMLLLLPWRQATQRVRTCHDYPQKSCTAALHDMITCEVECSPWHDYCTTCS